MPKSEGEPREEPFKFDVFISYSRRDLAFARRLHRALDNYTPPRDLRVPQRRLRVFRDESDFRGNEYASALDSALGSAAKLLVICSPTSRASSYVGAEIANFASLRGNEHIVSVLAAGRPNNEAGQDGGELAFHEELVSRLPIPLAADYRGWDEKRDRIDRDRFESAWFKLLADIYVDHGVERSELEGREKQRQRRVRRLRAAIAGTVMAALAALTTWALISRQEAIVQGKTARSRALALQSMARTQSFDLTMLLAVAAYKTAPTLEAWEALFAGSQRQTNVQRFLHGVEDGVDQIAISPSGACVVASTRQYRATVWDLASGSKRADIAGRALPDHSCSTLVMALPDGRLEARSLLDGQPLRWSAEPAGGAVTAWTSDATGTLLAVASAGGRLQVREIKTGRIRSERTTPSAIWRYIRFSADGQALIALDYDGMAHRWDGLQLSESPRVARCSESPGEVFAVSPDLNWCAAGGPAHLGIRELTREDAQTIDLGSPWILAVDFSPDGRTLVAGLQGGPVQTWRVDPLAKDGARTAPTVWTEHRGHVTAATYAPDGRTIISAALDRTVVVWNAQPAARLVSETVFDSRPTAIASDPNTRRIAVGTSTGDVLISQEGSAASFVKAANVGEPVTAMALTESGTVLVGTQAGEIFSVATGSAVRSISTEPRARAMRIKLSTDQARAAVIFADGHVQIRDLSTGQVVAQLADPTGQESDVGVPHTGADVAFEPGGSRVAFVRGGSQAYLWDSTASLFTALPIKPTVAFTSVAFAAGGPIALGTGMDQEEILLYDPSQPQQSAIALPNQNEQKTAVTALAFSPDNRILFSGQFDGTTSTWDVTGRRRLLDIIHRPGPIVDLTYARDGSAVTAVTGQGVALRWNLNPADWLTMACAIANRDLSAEERLQFLDDAKAPRTCARE